ncbi:MAG TPA: hypothetical protein VFN97_27895 [Actinospica sp.]|nr:hypothetical protein [Actinospica sp.]
MSETLDPTGSARGPGPRSLLLIGALAAWFTVSAAGQHPQRAFDRVRNYDRLGLLLPNWRFFAPEPAQHDFHLLHRVLTHDDEQTLWSESSSITPRDWKQMFWFPDRRREKALFDICGEILGITAQPALDVTRFGSYLLLRDFVTRAVRAEYAERPQPQGFQFVIARHTGFDTENEPEYLFISPFVPLTPESERAAHGRVRASGSSEQTEG